MIAISSIILTAVAALAVIIFKKRHAIQKALLSDEDEKTRTQSPTTQALVWRLA